MKTAPELHVDKIAIANDDENILHVHARFQHIPSGFTIHKGKRAPKSERYEDVSHWMREGWKYELIIKTAQGNAFVPARAVHPEEWKIPKNAFGAVIAYKEVPNV